MWRTDLLLKESITNTETTKDGVQSRLKENQANTEKQLQQLEHA